MLCRLLRVSRSGYYAWRKREPSPRDVSNAGLLEVIRLIHERSRKTYGSPRIHAELHEDYGIRCSQKRVARLMRLAGLVGIHRRKGCRRRGAPHPIFEDLVERNFNPAVPNKLWVADITQHKTLEGWLYLSVVLDCFSRKVVGWAMSNRADAEMVLGAVRMAIHNRKPEFGVIHHSDQGTQYTSLRFGKHLDMSGILGSMGRVGSAGDNAVMESFFATLQTELFNRHKWWTRSQLQTAIFEFIEVFYNRERRHSYLGYLSPVEFERRNVGFDNTTGVKLETVHVTG